MGQEQGIVRISSDQHLSAEFFKAFQFVRYARNGRNDRGVPPPCFAHASGQCCQSGTRATILGHQSRKVDRTDAHCLRKAQRIDSVCGGDDGRGGCGICHKVFLLKTNSLMGA